VTRTVSSDNKTLATSWGTYTLTPGSYTGYTLATHLQTLLGTTITVAFDSTAYHFTFTVAEGNITLYESGSTCFALLGFTSGADHTSTSGYLESDELVDLSGLTSIDVYSSLLCRNWPSGTNNIYSNQLAQIPITVPYGSQVCYLDTSGGYVPIFDQSIPYIRVTLLSSKTRAEVEMHNQNWSMVITFQVMERDESYQPLRTNILPALEQQPEHNGTSTSFQQTLGTKR
jgi:hypothetical protein